MFLVDSVSRIKHDRIIAINAQYLFEDLFDECRIVADSVSQQIDIRGRSCVFFVKQSIQKYPTLDREVLGIGRDGDTVKDTLQNICDKHILNIAVISLSSMLQFCFNGSSCFQIITSRYSLSSFSLLSIFA